MMRECTLWRMELVTRLKAEVQLGMGMLTYDPSTLAG